MVITTTIATASTTLAMDNAVIVIAQIMGVVWVVVVTIDVVVGDTI